MTTLQTLSSTLPILFLVAAGVLVRATRLLSEPTIQDIKRLIVSVSLPLVLFRAFATMTFEPRYLVIVASLFLSCTLVMFATARLHFLPGLRSPYASYLMAGFEAGMLGYAIFSSIYGADNVSYFAVVDLGQVLFVFFVLITRLKFQQQRQMSAVETLAEFLKTPVIIGILTGILANITGFYRLLSAAPLTDSLLSALGTLAGLTTPLVSLVIGSELRFERKGLWQPVQTVLLRLAVWVTLTIVFNRLVIHQLLGLDPLFEAASLLMAILPAPFVIPLYSQESDLAERAYILNVLSLGTVAALAGCVIIRLVY